MSQELRDGEAAIKRLQNDKGDALGQVEELHRGVMEELYLRFTQAIAKERPGTSSAPLARQIFAEAVKYEYEDLSNRILQETS